jgi:dTDP-4-amino-4,6-dideoxy-D-galactose acyltransferase
MDVRITMEQSLDGQCFGISNVIREANPQDLIALKRIARSSHENTRFFVDLCFERELSRKLYAIWIERSISNETEKVFVLTEEDVVIAYISCAIAELGKSSIGLLAVDPNKKGQGRAMTIVSHALAWLKKNGAVMNEVVTQGTNISALKLYEKMGFRIKDVKFWYHKWY